MHSETTVDVTMNRYPCVDEERCGECLTDAGSTHRAPVTLVEDPTTYVDVTHVWYCDNCDAYSLLQDWLCFVCLDEEAGA